MPPEPESQRPSSTRIDRPVEKLVDLVNYVLCLDNDSDGVTFLRGWVAHHDGIFPKEDAVILTIMELLREDDDLWAVVERVERHTFKRQLYDQTFIVVKFLVKILCDIYRRDHQTGADEL